jgi:IstB-like ATP binding protein
MMELSVLLERLKLDHLLTQLDGVCEQAAKSDLDYQGFLARALEAEWRGRQQRGIDLRLRMARFPWLKTLEQFDFECQPSLDRKVLRELGPVNTTNVVCAILRPWNSPRLSIVTSSDACRPHAAMSRSTICRS